MAKITVEETKDFLLLPPDSILSLKVDELTFKDAVSRNGAPWTKLEFKFKILGIQALGDGSSVDEYDSIIGGPIWGSTSARLTTSPDNRLRQWTEAILGVEVGAGMDLETDLFLGREVRGITSQYEKRTKDSTGRPMRGHQIDSLLPKAGATPNLAMAAPAAVETPAWEEAPF